MTYEDLILGTAGHIDHGKSSLIQALTGIDTDRLPEEKQRGITIELGFAELVLGRYRLGIVDVPGHERFVRNMLAGATGMDLALLVVAADDSVKPQTLEHLEILRLLELPAGVIALTKCDLVEPDWRELVAEEVREAVAGTFLESAPIVPTSTVSGEGLEQLRRELQLAAEQAAGRVAGKREGPFRMAVDRVFSVTGHGTVVTGSVSRGAVGIGDELTIQPGEIKVRVRSLQNHDRQVERVEKGQRAAMNLVGGGRQEIRRGQELSSPGHLRASRRITAKLRLLESSPRPVKDRATVRLHVGTTEVLSRVRWLDRKQLLPGESAYAQVFLAEPAAVVWGQPFVLRSESPVETIGGGLVLVPAAERLRGVTAIDLEMLEQLEHPDPPIRAAAALYFQETRPVESEDLVRLADVDDYQQVFEQLFEQQIMVPIEVSPQRTQWIHRQVLNRIAQRIVQRLETLHDRNPLRQNLDRQPLASDFDYLPRGVFDRAIALLIEEGRVRVDARRIGLVGRGPQLSQNERRLKQQLVERFAKAGIETPSIEQCQAEASKNQQSVPQLLELLVADGDLVAVNSTYYLHAETESRMRKRLVEAFGERNGLTVSEIREILETTRKYVVPLCEFWDRQGFTKRAGDVRVLAAPPKEAGAECG